MPTSQCARCAVRSAPLKPPRIVCAAGAVARRHPARLLRGAGLWRHVHMCMVCMVHARVPVHVHVPEAHPARGPLDARGRCGTASTRPRTSACTATASGCPTSRPAPPTRASPSATARPWSTLTRWSLARATRAHRARCPRQSQSHAAPHDALRPGVHSAGPVHAAPTQWAPCTPLHSMLLPLPRACGRAGARRGVRDHLRVDRLRGALGGARGGPLPRLRLLAARPARRVRTPEPRTRRSALRALRAPRAAAITTACAWGVAAC